MWEIIGILMVISGSCYALPQLLRCIKRGSAKGISAWFIAFWLFDKLISLTYVIHISDLALSVKYSLATFFVLVIGYYKTKD